MDFTTFVLVISLLPSLRSSWQTARRNPTGYLWLLGHRQGRQENPPRSRAYCRITTVSSSRITQDFWGPRR
ncbi:hypothetical protein OF83DRAFT_1109990, partial [Amylostereum chailletii]